MKLLIRSINDNVECKLEYMKKKDNVKNDKKNLDDPKKSCTFAPVIAPRQVVTSGTYTPIFEKSSAVPTDKLVPNEALGLREMFDRTQRGQRLNVHTRMRTDDCPDNMYRAEFEVDPVSGLSRMKKDQFEESFDHVPPGDMYDITDVLRYSEEIAARKKELQEKRRKDIANARKSAPAQEPGDDKNKPREDDKPEE